MKYGVGDGTVLVISMVQMSIRSGNACLRRQRERIQFVLSIIVVSRCIKSRSPSFALVFAFIAALGYLLWTFIHCISIVIIAIVYFLAQALCVVNRNSIVIS